MWRSLAIGSLLVTLVGCTGSNAPLSRRASTPAGEIPASGPTLLPYGNAEPYNGPRLEGESIPTLADTALDLGKLSRIVAKCAEEASFDLLAQLGDVDKDSLASTGAAHLTPIPRAFNESTLDYSGRVDFKLKSNPSRLYRLDTTALTGLTAAAPLPAAHQLRAIFYPQSADYRGDELFTELTDGLPRLRFRLEPADEIGQGTRPEATFHVEDLSVEIADEHGFVPLKDSKTQRTVGLELNTNVYAQCVQFHSQGIEQEPLSAPPGLANVTPSADALADFLEPLQWDGAGDKILLRAVTLRKVAVNIYHRYREGHWTEHDSKRWQQWCDSLKSGTLATRADCDRLTREVSNVFYEHSIDELEDVAKKMPEVSRLVARLGKMYRYPRFHVDLGPRDAGYHRGAAFVTMNFNLVKPDEWSLVFLHEMLHSVDPMLKNAVHEYAEISRQGMSDEALLQGLHRGFLAEWRAWVVTLELYRRGLDKGLFESNALMEKALPSGAARQMTFAHLKQYVFTRLDKSYVDPTTGPFASPDVHARLARLRERLRRGEVPLELGALGELL